MKLDIDTANAAKAELVTRFGLRLETATLVLGDHGFYLLAIPRAGVRLEGEFGQAGLRVGGIDVLWGSQDA